MPGEKGAVESTAVIDIPGVFMAKDGNTRMQAFMKSTVTKGNITSVCSA